MGVVASCAELRVCNRFFTVRSVFSDLNYQPVYSFRLLTIRARTSATDYLGSIGGCSAASCAVAISVLAGRRRGVVKTWTAATPNRCPFGGARRLSAVLYEERDVSQLPSLSVRHLRVVFSTVFFISNNTNYSDRSVIHRVNLSWRRCQRRWLQSVARMN